MIYWLAAIALQLIWSDSDQAPHFSLECYVGYEISGNQIVDLDIHCPDEEIYDPSLSASARELAHQIRLPITLDASLEYRLNNTVVLTNMNGVWQLDRPSWLVLYTPLILSTSGNAYISARCDASLEIEPGLPPQNFNIACQSYDQNGIKRSNGSMFQRSVVRALERSIWLLPEGDPPFCATVSSFFTSDRGHFEPPHNWLEAPVVNAPTCP